MLWWLQFRAPQREHNKHNDSNRLKIETSTAAEEMTRWESAAWWWKSLSSRGCQFQRRQTQIWMQIIAYSCGWFVMMQTWSKNRLLEWGGNNLKKIERKNGKGQEEKKGSLCGRLCAKDSATGTRTLVWSVRGIYDNHLHYSRMLTSLTPG
jgi:hypothetical protein